MAEKKQVLFSDDSLDSEVNFAINENYAQGHDKWRRNEELQKLKAKYGDSGLSSSSSESEEEDVPLIEKNFLKTLSLLKSNDPKIYNENLKFFDESEKPKMKPKAKKSKSLLFQNFEHNQASEKISALGDEEAHPDISSIDDQGTRKMFKTQAAESESDEDEDNIFSTSQKNHAKSGEMDVECISWLKGEKAQLSGEDADDDLNYLHDYWADPNLEGDEQYLKDYILNEKYTEKDGSDVMPSYGDVVENLSDDEEILEKQAVFEQKYNFRFEEPDSEFIKQYPRTIGDSLRRTDKKRKVKRNEYQERKQQEKEQKREEIKMLKALKRGEIEDMINKLKDTGGDNLNFDYGDIDGDFDPHEHDKRMKELFNEEYYGVEETEKPEFPCDEEFDGENWDNWTGDLPNSHGEEGPHCEDPDFNMDVDYNPKLEFQRKMIESQTKKSKKRRKSKFAEVVASAKPVFDPSSKQLQEYIDEYYNLDCEDVIGDEVFRFKYRNVVANDFGLSAKEILVARDKELNRWCSLKKTCQYRNDEEENYDIAAFRKKTENVTSKKKIIPSLFEESEDKASDILPESSNKKSHKRKRKSKKMDESKSSENGDDNVLQPVAKRSKTKDNNCVKEETMTCDNIVKEKEENPQEQKSNVGKKKKRKKKKSTGGGDAVENKKPSVPSPAAASRKQQSKHNQNYQNDNLTDKRLQLSDARLKAYGINPKKFKNRIKYSKKAKEM